jgi:hypothetical protein
MTTLDTITKDVIRTLTIVGREAAEVELGITGAKGARDPVVALRVIDTWSAEHLVLACPYRRRPLPFDSSVVDGGSRISAC